MHWWAIEVVVVVCRYHVVPTQSLVRCCHVRRRLFHEHRCLAHSNTRLEFRGLHVSLLSAPNVFAEPDDHRKLESRTTSTPTSLPAVLQRRVHRHQRPRQRAQPLGFPPFSFHWQSQTPTLRPMASHVSTQTSHRHTPSSPSSLWAKASNAYLPRRYTVTSRTRLVYTFPLLSLDRRPFLSEHRLCT